MGYAFVADIDVFWAGTLMWVKTGQKNVLYCGSASFTLDEIELHPGLYYLQGKHGYERSQEHQAKR